MSLKPKSVLNGQSREFVIRLRDYFRRESENGGPLLPVSQVVDRVAEALGISRKTISRITKEKYGVDGTEENALKTPGTKRLKKKPITGTESLDINAILKHITDYQNCNEQFTATKLRLSLIDAGLFSGGKTSFYRLLKRLGFCFEKSGKMKVLSMKRFVIKSDGPAKSKSKKCKKAIAPLPDFNPAVAPAPLENKALCPSMGHLLPHHNMVLKQTDPALVANDNMRKMMLDCGGYNQHLIYPNVNRHHNDPL